MKKNAIFDSADGADPDGNAGTDSGPDRTDTSASN